ncbi:unnamed protein product [Allacma fusca]|uniref:Kazal-like domain-containing protein n=1 Tax=Allacma fusca TaxID=39272 RepID=A0A8J2NZE9_9HEXA|nr:unnamed protein product [Allacma fusca]
MNPKLIFALILFLAAATIIVAQPGGRSDCRTGTSAACHCPRNYKPVCGTNKQTYSNECNLKCDNICNRKIRVDYNGPCKRRN